MRRNLSSIIIAIGLVIALTAAVIAVVLISNKNGTGGTSSTDTTTNSIQSSPSSSVSSEESSEPSSEAPSSEVLSAPVVSTIDPNNPYYDILVAVDGLDRARHGYGFGIPVDANNRPKLAQENQRDYGRYGMAAITDDMSTIYLTFDEGYEAGYTAKILDVLKEKNCTATFFITMHYAKANAGLVRRMIDEGHVVGNHSVNHPDMTTISPERMIKEIMELHEYVLEHFGYEMKLFRPPTGAYSITSLEVARLLNYQTVEWSFAYEDWDTGNQPDNSFAYDYITGRTHGGAIYLLHAVSRTNAEVLGDVIDYWRNEGYTVTAYPNVGTLEN